MQTIPNAHRLLVLAEEGSAERYRDLLRSTPLSTWTISRVESWEETRFHLGMESCDLVLLAGPFADDQHGGEVRWLLEGARVPVVLLCPLGSPLLGEVCGTGMLHWLPPEVAVACPELLRSTLERAATLADSSRPPVRPAQTLIECQRQVHRLSALLWSTIPDQGQLRWFSQRHMLERLHEEVLRTERYGHPLTLVLGEVGGKELVRGSGRSSYYTCEGHADLASWTAQKVVQGKRRSDVAGQYGEQGFMLLLPSTSAQGAEDCCQRIRSLLENEPFQGEPDSEAIPLHARFGVAYLPAGQGSAKRLLREAEESLDSAT